MSLHEIAARNDVSGLMVALQRGGNINQRDEEGATPLMYAALAGAEDAFVWLVVNGADASVTDHLGRTVDAYRAAYQSSLSMSEEEIEFEKNMAFLREVLLRGAIHRGNT